ncbi:TonB-dependent receptor [Komagataeibacter saccharivorans]|uniref:TonB-dependent receptor n=1 Tax=Komagataeibacter saccharivorans TaxID=265959 RepID=UPI0039E73600
MSSRPFFVKLHLGLTASVSCAAMMQVSSLAAATPVVAQKPARAHVHQASGQGVAKDHAAVPHAAPESIKVSAARAVQFRREQHVPDSATHISGKELVERNVRAMTDLIRVAPNLSIQPSNGSAGLNFVLRGVGMADLTQNNIPSVMPYVDGVALPVTVMTSAIMYDMDNVSVNPGQSGFTHGMTTTGGEINFHTADPTPQFHAGVTEDIASYGRNRVEGFVSGPISRSVSYRISGMSMTGGGFQHNSQGAGYGNADIGALRGKLKWQIDDTTRLDVGGHWSTDQSDAPGGAVMVNSYGVPASTDLMQTNWGLSKQFANAIGVNPANQKPRENNLSWGVNIHFTKDFTWGKLSSTSAYEMLDEHELSDQTNTALAYGNMYRNNQTNFFSQEIKLESNNAADRLQWAVGMYYNRGRTNDNFWYDMSDRYASSDNGKYFYKTAYGQDEQTFNQYAQLSYRLVRGLRLIGAISHESDDRQLIDLVGTTYEGTAAPKVQSFGSSGALANQFSGRVGLEYQITHDIMTYVDFRRGFKPGGFSANMTSVAAQLRPFKPEQVLSYEGGFKTSFMNDRIRFNAAGFYYDYRDQQLLGTIVVPQYGTEGTYVNAPRSYIYGAEFNAMVRPFRGMTLSQNFGYQHGVYSQYQGVNKSATTDLYNATGQWTAVNTNYNGAGMGLANLTLSGAATYTWKLLRNYRMTFDVDYSYRGAQTQPQYIGYGGYYRAPAYFLVNSFLTFSAPQQHWSVTVYGQNLADRHYWLSGGTQSTFYSVIPGNPRFVGARINCTY